ncbi:MFS transporter [Dactylosporangium sp. NPDC006015]|uniref:MFS transporter n=1 Tax=Dactylosporangium sp. NPDC006015 TaxID=3154576 RepID=UPI0033AB90E7
MHPRTELVATFALAALAFIVVTGETTPIGLISDIASGVGSTESRVGLTVSWYALVAGGTAVPLTRWTARFDRRWVLAASTAAFSVGHVATAAAGNLTVLAAGRGLAAVGHGLFFALAAPTAQRLARPSTRGRAAGRVMVGGSAALVVGTPLATGLGQLAGWRAALLAIAAVSLLLAVAVLFLVPSVADEPGTPADHPRLPEVLRLPGLVPVLGVLLATVVGHFALFTYVAPFAAERFGLHGTTLTVLLLVYGVCAVIGSNLGGRLSDTRPITGTRAASVVFVVALAGVWSAGLAAAPYAGVPMLLVWGGTFSVLVVATSLAVLRRAPGRAAEPANAVYGIVFQIGIVSGSAVGSWCYAAGSVTAIPLVAMAAGAVAVALVATSGQAFRAADPG